VIRFHNDIVNGFSFKAAAAKINARTLCLTGLLLTALGSNPARADDGLAVPYRFDDVERWAEVFERPQRDSYQMPERVLATLDLAAGVVVADVGAATGYFARRFARAVGGSGRVYAVDIEAELLAWLDERARREGIENISTLVATATDSRLPDHCCDLIFLCNTYHMIAARVAYLNHLQRKLKPGGRVVIIDWRKKPLPRGPRPEWKLTARQVAEETGRAGLCAVDQPEFLPYQYFFVLRPCNNG
jgi:ubiquinone/menaquinone biosynthesis C-methylase UbiE